MIRFITVLFCLLFVCEAHAEPVALKMRNASASVQLNAALNDANYWAEATRYDYRKQLYDEIRLKTVGDGHMTMITGEGEQDYPHEIVADTVFLHQDQLQSHMEGCKRVLELGSGIDPVNGLPYMDVFYYMDLTAFYTSFTQRMYQITDDSGRSIMFFEKIDSSFVDAQTWSEYQRKIDAVSATVDRRSIFGALVPIEDVFGMFIVEPGDNHESRVTLIAKLYFGDEAGWIAQVGSKIPIVLKEGLQSGFDACVSISRSEKARL